MTLVNTSKLGKVTPLTDVTKMEIKESSVYSSKYVLSAVGDLHVTVYFRLLLYISSGMKL